MRKWLDKIGYLVVDCVLEIEGDADREFQVTDLNCLSVIHVAGMKGKGSTCLFVDSILREYRIKTYYPPKVGLYTSPHLKDVRERIQINSKPISEETFTRYFFKSWDKIAPGDILDLYDRPG